MLKKSLAMTSLSTGSGTGRLDVFGIDPHNCMTHVAYINNKWSAPESLNVPPNILFTTAPVAAAWQQVQGQNRWDVFALGNDTALYHKAYTNSGWDAQWESIGAPFYSAPAIVSWGAGRLDVFGIGNGNIIYHQYRDANGWAGTPWQSLLTTNLPTIPVGYFHSAPSVVSWGTGRLDVFALGSDNLIYHRWFDNNVWNSTNWESLGSQSMTGFAQGSFISAPAAVSMTSGRLDVFAVGQDGNLYRKWLENSVWNPSATTWEGMGSYRGVLFNSDPVAVSWGTNRLDVFVSGTDSQIYHLGGLVGFSPGLNWEQLPEKTHICSTPAAATWGNNRLDVVNLGAGNLLSHDWWDGSWHHVHGEEHGEHGEHGETHADNAGDPTQQFNTAPGIPGQL